MGLGLEATLPLDTLCRLTLHWTTPQATQGAMGFTTAMEATVDCMEAPITANKDSIVHIQYSFIKKK